jgi:hypothetical protein
VEAVEVVEARVPKGKCFEGSKDEAAMCRVAPKLSS